MSNHVNGYECPIWYLSQLCVGKILKRFWDHLLAQNFKYC